MVYSPNIIPTALISNIILMRTLAFTLLLSIFLCGKTQTRSSVNQKETFLSVKQVFYTFGIYQGTAHKIFHCSLQDSVLMINNLSWKLTFIKELEKENGEEKMRQYSSQDSKGTETIIRTYYEGTLLTDISFTVNYTSCHFYIVKTYPL